MDQWEQFLLAQGVSPAEIEAMRVQMPVAPGQATPMAPMAPTPPPATMQTGPSLPQMQVPAQPQIPPVIADSIRRIQQAQTAPQMGPPVALPPPNPAPTIQAGGGVAPSIGAPSYAPPPAPPSAPPGSTGLSAPPPPSGPEAWAALSQMLEPSPQVAPAPGVPVQSSTWDVPPTNQAPVFNPAGPPLASQNLDYSRPAGPGMTAPVSSTAPGAPGSEPAGRMPPNLPSSTGISRPGEESRAPSSPGNPMDWKSLIGIIGLTLGMGPRRGETTGQLLARAMGNGMALQQAQQTSAQQQSNVEAQRGIERERTAIMGQQAQTGQFRAQTDARQADAQIAMINAKISLIPDEQQRLRLSNEFERIKLETEPRLVEAKLQEFASRNGLLQAQTAAAIERPDEKRSKLLLDAQKAAADPVTGGMNLDRLYAGYSTIPGVRTMGGDSLQRFRTMWKQRTAGMDESQKQRLRTEILTQGAQNNMLPPLSELQ